MADGVMRIQCKWYDGVWLTEAFFDVGLEEHAETYAEHIRNVYRVPVRLLDQYENLVKEWP